MCCRHSDTEGGPELGSCNFWGQASGEGGRLPEGGGRGRQAWAQLVPGEREVLLGAQVPMEGGVCVCVCVCVCVSERERESVGRCACVHVCTCACRWGAYVHICEPVCLCVSVAGHKCVHVCICVHIYACRLQACVCVSV